ncbi:XRE family transcriptional regulator, partial [bacterium]
MASTKRIRKAKKSLGGYLLTRVADTQAEVAAKIGVSKPAVSQFIGGTSPPSAETKEAIEAAYPSVPASSWDEPWPETPAAEPRKSTKPKSLDELHEDLVQTLQGDLERLQGDTNLADAKRAERLTKLANALIQLRKVSG